MRSKISRLFFITPVIFSLLFPIDHLHADTMGTRAMVATADPHATRAAYEVLQKGGNAVDAAIAAQWVLNVVEPQSSGIGGGGFFLYYDAATKRIYAFDGREKAPEESHPEMFLDDAGKPCIFRPDCITGGRPVGVPGVLKLLQHVHERFGSKKISFAELFDRGVELAENGFPVSKRLAHFIETQKDRLQLFEASRKTFLDSFQRPLVAGTILQQPDLAATFRMIQKKGVTAFYEGEIAEAIVDAVRKSPVHPGNMKKTDMVYYDVKEREPVQGTYRGYDIFSMAPPSSGGTTLIEALNILEIYPMTSKARTADGVHLFAEAQKLAFQDRNDALGDPDFVKVPVDKLISKKFASERAQEIQMDKAAADTPLPARLPTDASNTTHISIVDEQGNMVSFTSTIEDIFGSALMVPGWGFFLNNELTDFDIEPKKADGKLKANAPEGEKRPRSSMTPTFVFKQGKPVLVAGSPGGSKIIGIVLNVLINVLDFGMSLEPAMAAPRVIHRAAGSLEMEPIAYDTFELRRELERRGHSVLKVEPFGNAQVIYINPDSGVMTGASDPRGEGEAAGY